MTLVYWNIFISIFAVIISRGRTFLSTNNYINEENNTGRYNKSFLLLFVLWIVYSVIFGLREGFVDTSTYKSMAERIGSDFSNLSNSSIAIVEPGFNAFMILCNKISGNDSQFFIFVTTALTFAGAFILFHRESSDSALSAFFFITFVSFTYINGIRQAIVAVVFALVYSKWKDKKFLVIAVCLVLALFHTSSLLLIPLYLCIDGKVFNWKIKILYCFALFCVVGGARVQQILSTVLNERYSETLNVMTSGTGIMRVLVNLVPAALALIQYKVCGIRDKRDAQIANIFLIDAAINICSLNSSYFARMSIYFALFIAAYYPRVIHKTFNTRSQVIAYTFFIAFYTLFYLYQAYTFASYGYMREFHLVI